MKFSYVIAIILCTVLATVGATSQCPIKDVPFQSCANTIKPVSCDDIVPASVDTWSLIMLVFFTCIAANVTIFQAPLLLCLIVAINHHIVASMMKSQGMCV